MVDLHLHRHEIDEEVAGMSKLVEELRGAVSSLCNERDQLRTRIAGFGATAAECLSELEPLACALEHHNFKRCHELTESALVGIAKLKTLLERSMVAS